MSTNIQFRGFCFYYLGAHLAAGRVGGDGGHVLDTANAHAGTGEGTEGALSTRAGGLGASTTGSPELDVEGSDADLAAADGDVLRGKHGSVRGGLVTVSLDLHATWQTETSRKEQGIRFRAGLDTPVTREIVSLPERSVTWTKVSLNEA